MRSLDKDRTTRLAIMITLIGGAFFLCFRFSFYSWFKIFYSTTYTKTIMHVEHYIAILVFTVTLLVAAACLRYIYFELKTLQYLRDNDAQKDAIEKADSSFTDIFSYLKFCSGVLIIFFSILSIIEIIRERPILLLWILIGGIALLTFLVLGWLLFVKRKKQGNISILKRHTDSAKRSKEKLPIGFFLYIVSLVIFIGITISLVALNGDKEIEVKIIKGENITLQVVSNKIGKLELEGSIENRDTYGQSSDFNSSDFEIIKSEVHVFGKKELLNNELDIDKIAEELQKRNYRFDLDQSNQSTLFNLDLNDFLKGSRNTIKLVIKVKENEETNFIYFESDISIRGKDILISEDNLKVSI
ncbi:hypothetical protein [Terribacillus saccharophilus]|uniref:hypothetical protein n=1 Tax=Terribacillus saccharophilus TaxID=361277 RepID=UPI0011AF9B28|nr:hypothetical protein [Terribacillus goriensis]